LLVFFLHALLTMHGHRNIKLLLITNIPTYLNNANSNVTFTKFIHVLQCGITSTNWGHAVVQWNEALLYKPEGRGFDSLWYHWKFH